MDEPQAEQQDRRKLQLRLDPRPTIIFGVCVVVVAFGGIGSWAAVAPIASAVIGPGFVTVDTNRKKVQHVDGGIVRELLVRDGDNVNRGDTLLRLDETQPRANLAILQSEYDVALAIEARLLAERDGLEIIDFPQSVLKRMHDAKVASIVESQADLFRARRSSLDGEVSILENRIGQLHDNISGLKAQSKAKRRQIGLIWEELKGLKELFKKGYTERSRILALEREAAELEGERGEHVSEIAHAKTKIGETELQILQLQRDFQERVIEELRTVQTEIADLEQRITAATYVLEHVQVRAPASGTVVGTAVHTVGGVIRPGDTILEIVPAGDRLIIEARVQPLDIDSVAVGQRADVYLTAYKRWTAASIGGDVVYISADRMIDERSGEAYYLVRVEVADEELARLGDVKLYPGMPAEVMIKTGERTALQYLAQPLLDSLNRAWREE